MSIVTCRVLECLGIETGQILKILELWIQATGEANPMVQELNLLC